MASPMRLSGLLLLVFGLPGAETTMLTDPRLCYILDGFLGLYGLIITGMFIKEKFFRTKVKSSDENIYNDPRVTTTHRDPEQGRQRRKQEETYTPLRNQDGGEYKELRVKERPRKNEQDLYQDLSAASRDTYNTLQMQPLTAR